MGFHDFPRFVGNLGVDLDQPPKNCAPGRDTLAVSPRGAELRGRRRHDAAARGLRAGARQRGAGDGAAGRGLRPAGHARAHAPHLRRGASPRNARASKLVLKEKYMK